MPLVWLLASPPLPWTVTQQVASWFQKSTHKQSIQRTQARLRVAKNLINEVITTTKGVPLDLSYLRAYASAKGRRLSLYDGYGQRLSYLRLDDNHFLLRSFGHDGIQNSMSTPGDALVGKLPVRPTQGLTFRYGTAAQLDMFPAVLVAGAASPSRLWDARLYIDKLQGTRRLVTRHSTKKGLIMVADHDAIEEYLWLPNGYQIVYTATGSNRYRDGLFLWNLLDDTTQDLTELVAAKNTTKDRKLDSGTPGGRISKLYLSLAGINVNGPTVYIYHAPRSDGRALDPESFFAKANLLAFEIPDKPMWPHAILDLRHELVNAEPPFAKPLQLADHVDGANEHRGLRVQQSWLQLQLHGDMEQILLSWQAFSEREADTALLPYCLWYLATLYSESFSTLVTTGQVESKEADVLRTYGTELARALADYPLAPSYLRGLALHTYDGLMAGKPLPYRFAHLTIGAAVEKTKEPGNPQLSVRANSMNNTTRASRVVKSARAVQPPPADAPTNSSTPSPRESPHP